MSGLPYLMIILTESPKAEQFFSLSILWWKISISYISVYIIISKMSVCLFVCPAIDSALRHYKVLRPVSSEPEWPEGVQRQQNSSIKMLMLLLLKLSLNIIFENMKQLFNTCVNFNKFILTISRNQFNVFVVVIFDLKPNVNRDQT